MAEEKELTYEEWEETYKPLRHEDGEIMHFDKIEDVFKFLGKNPPSTDQDTWLEVRSKLWTETAGDGWYYISTGFHIVDRMHHFICEVPWKKENEASVYEDLGSYCEFCDRNVHKCQHDDDDWQDKADLLAEEKAEE